MSRISRALGLFHSKLGFMSILAVFSKKLQNSARYKLALILAVFGSSAKPAVLGKCCVWQNSNAHSGHQSVFLDNNPANRRFQDIAFTLLNKKSNLVIKDTGLNHEHLNPENQSYGNKTELDMAFKIVQDLMNCGVSTKSIRIISMYAEQLNLLRNKFKGVPINMDTVDSVQGKESDAVIISMYAEQLSLLRNKFKGVPINMETVDSAQGREAEVVIILTVKSNEEASIGIL